MSIISPVTGSESVKLTPNAARLELSRLSSGEGVTLQDIFRRMTEIAADTLEVDRVGIWFFIDHHKALRCAYLFERSKREHSEGMTIRVADYPSYLTGLENQRVIAATDAAVNPQTRVFAEPYFQPLGIRATLDAPVFLEGAVIGVVCHEHIGSIREWTAEERDFAVTIADQTALKMKGAELAQARETLRTQDAQLAEARRLDAVGRMAAGIAHDFNNLLAVIHGSAVMLARMTSLPAEAREWSRHILEAADRGMMLAADLSRCARESTQPARVLSPVLAAERMLPLLRAAAGPRCPIVFTHDAHMGKVFIDPSGLERVLLNLVINAREAMPNGGAITIRIRGISTNGQQHICLEIADTGIGIDPAIQPMIFEAFFSTRTDGRGSGLGLAVVKQVVDRAGGEVRVESEPGRGTRFQVLLPRVSAQG